MQGIEKRVYRAYQIKSNHFISGIVAHIANRQTDTHKQLATLTLTHTHANTQSIKTSDNKNICTSITHWHGLGQSTIQFN